VASCSFVVFNLSLNYNLIALIELLFQKEHFNTVYFKRVFCCEEKKMNV